MIEEGEKSFRVDSATLDFLVYTLFGKSYREILEMADEGMDGVLDLCAQRAYRDLSRTLRFYSADSKDGRNEVEAKKMMVLKELRDAVVDGARVLLWAESQEKFNCLHEKICGEGSGADYCWSIAGAAREAPGRDVLKPAGKEKKMFYPGQAQKWLNMTLKYFWILDLPQFRSILRHGERYLHAPIDGYILNMLKDEGLLASAQAESSSNSADAKKVIKAARVPWSQWSYEDYAEIQALVRNLSESSGRCPIEWEMRTWLDASAR